MKIYMLLTLIGVFVGFSYNPIRGETKSAHPGGARIGAGTMPKA